MMIDMKHETWAALQDFTPDDVADAICDSKAILEAILSNAWADVADMVRARVELKALRMAEISLELPTTPWVDDEEELNLWRFYRMERLQEQIEQEKGSIPTINPYHKRGQQ
jgi:hypothetical protein